MEIIWYFYPNIAKNLDIHNLRYNTKLLWVILNDEYQCVFKLHQSCVIYVTKFCIRLTANQATFVTFFFLPWDIISGAQTATVLFPQVLRTQWYLNLSRFVQFCISAICSQGFRRFARSNSASFEGHDDIVSIVDKDTKHCSSAYIGLCCVVYSINIVFKRNCLYSL